MRCILLLLPALLFAKGNLMGNATRPISLAFYEYGMLYDNGVGIDRDIVTELTRRSGCPFTFQVMARARIWSDLSTGKLDMSVSGIENSERDQFASFAPYLSMKNYAIIEKSTARTVSNPSQFLANNKLLFGAVSSFKHGAEQDQFLSQMRAQGRVEESSEAESIFKKIGGGRVQGMFSQPLVYQKYLTDLAMKESVVIQDWTPNEKGVYHGLIMARSRFNDADAALWQKMIQDMKADGTLLSIYKKYLPVSEAVRLLEF